MKNGRERRAKRERKQQGVGENSVRNFTDVM
jgi:hypothetical protein